MQTELQEPTKAGAAERTESRRPKSPNRNGKVASDQLLSDMPQCKILIRHSCNLKSNREGKEPREEDGTYFKRWETSQTPRILLSRHNSTWGSSRRTSICADKNELKNCGGPQIGDSRRSKLSLNIRLMAGGKLGKELSPEGQCSSHLDRLIWRPKLGLDSIKRERNVWRRDLEPIKVPSSKYHRLRRHDLEKEMDWRNFTSTKEKSKRSKDGSFVCDSNGKYKEKQLDGYNLELLVVQNYYLPLKYLP